MMDVSLPPLSLAPPGGIGLHILDLADLKTERHGTEYPNAPMKPREVPHNLNKTIH